MKKRWTAMVLVSALVLSIAGCGTQEEQEQQSGQIQEETAQENTEQTAENGDKNVLVAYFSWADNAVLAEDVDAVSSPSVIPPGNVQQLAGWGQEETGGDQFSIRVTDPYPSDWDECLERANDEQITTEAGDLILYQGNSFVIYYAPNSWNFTRLGKINDVSEEELREILGDGDVTVTLSLPE